VQQVAAADSKVAVAAGALAVVVAQSCP
jgi:hypothetical protein